MASKDTGHRVAPPAPVLTGQTRRGFLRQASAGVAAACMSSRQPALPYQVESIRVISEQPQFYHGWPTLFRRHNGQLMLVYSGGREAHVCPFGRVELMRSNDCGATWAWPQVLLDGPIDDRDCGGLETSRGSILVTTFTSLAFEAPLEAANNSRAETRPAWPADKLSRWNAARDRISSEERKRELGVWMIRSTDGGVTWSARYDCLVNSPHGPIQLSDGRLLYAGKDLWRGTSRIGVCDSTDDGITWRWLAEIPARPGDSWSDYHELHAVETSPGRILVHIRNENRSNNRETLSASSSDGGKTWSEPRPIGVWGLPSHLLKLRDGGLLMSYGYRRAPFGIQSRLSRDHGDSWSDPIVLSKDGNSGDLGYPSTVELDDGALITVWYELLARTDRAVLRQARWRLNA